MIQRLAQVLQTSTLKAFISRRSKAVGLNSKGMSLIEIMIVLTIIGGIMGFLLPRVMGQREKAQVKQAKLFVSQISESAQAYATDCGKFPQSLDNLRKPDANCSNWGPDPYYKKEINDPWGNPLTYSVSGGEYEIKSLGRDGKEGGSGYDKDISSNDL